MFNQQMGDPYGKPVTIVQGGCFWFALGFIIVVSFLLGLLAAHVRF